MIILKDFSSAVIKQTFGNNSQMTAVEQIKDGLASISLKVSCDQHDKPLFLKIEKAFEIPRTQKYQIKREIAGIKLCHEKGINVPTIISSDESGLLADRPWLLEDYIDGKSVYEYRIDDANKKLISREYTHLFEKIVSIESDYYGDTFTDGFIGHHLSWLATLAKMTSIILADCVKMEIFDSISHKFVEEALQKALYSIKFTSKPVFFHYDLLSGNIFAEEVQSIIHLGCLFDFGMSLFAPIHYAYWLTSKLNDLMMEKIDELEKLGFDHNEDMAYEILRLESVLLDHVINRNDGQTGPSSYMQQYVNKCKEFVGQ